MAQDILDIAKLAGLSRGHHIATYQDVESARAGLAAKWQEIDLLLLDLNIPLNSKDSLPEKRHGASILDFVLNDLNSRGNHKISVIIVSGEVEPTVERGLWLDGKYKSVLVGLAAKGQLSVTLPEILRSYCEDHYVAVLRAHWPAAEQGFQTIINDEEDAERRTLACQTVASLMLKNIAQYERKLPDQNSIAGLQLKDLLNDYLVRNFNPANPANPKGVYPILKHFKGPADSWVLRGYIVEYLSTINSFRNAFIHISDTGPFHNGSSSYGLWTEFNDEISRLERGHRMCQMLVLLMKDVLDWYMPWHRKVYTSWLKTQTPSSGSTTK